MISITICLKNNAYSGKVLFFVWYFFPCFSILERILFSAEHITILMLLVIDQILYSINNILRVIVSYFIKYSFNILICEAEIQVITVKLLSSIKLLIKISAKRF